MKACLRLLACSLFFALTLSGCEGLYPPAEKDRQMVLCYFSSHNNSLSEASRSVLNDIRSAALPSADDDSKVLLVYYHLADTVPVLARMSRDGDGKLVETRLMTYPGNGTLSVKSLSAEQLKQVWTDAQTLFPSRKHSLFISSHGSGYLPSGYLSDPEDRTGPADEDPFRFLVKSGEDTRTIGPDDDLEINIQDFISAFNGYHFDVIMFDCCYMGGVEVAYEMKNLCDYMVAAPTEVMSKGIICGEMIMPSFSASADSVARSVCNIYMNRVKNDPEYRSSGTVSAVKSSELDELATVCSDIFSRRRSNLDHINPQTVQPYFRNRQHWFYDLTDLVCKLCTNEDGTQDEAYASFRSAMEKAVVYKGTTPKFLEITINTYSGLSTYLPDRNCPNLNNYYKTLSWSKNTGFVK